MIRKIKIARDNKVNALIFGDRKRNRQQSRL